MNNVWYASLQNFDAEISAVVAETVWDTPERQKYLSETIVEHLYRQGMLSVAEDLCQVKLALRTLVIIFSAIYKSKQIEVTLSGFRIIVIYSNFSR